MDPDPLIREKDPDTAPDLDPFIIKQKYKVRKTLIPTVL
jgi:hypothetical protein